MADIKQGSFDATILALKILSCMVQVEEKYGAYLIASILRGKNDKKVKDLGLDKLSTYGIIRDLSVKQIIAVIYFLMHLGFIHRSLEYNNLKLTEKGKQFLKEKPRFSLPTKILDDAKGSIFAKKLTSTQLQTLSLWQKGLSLSEISKQRSLILSTIENHLADLVYHQKIDDISNLISKDDYQLISSVLKNNPDARLKTIKEQLPEIISFGQIKIVLAFIERSNDKQS